MFVEYFLTSYSEYENVRVCNEEVETLSCLKESALWETGCFKPQSLFTAVKTISVLRSLCNLRLKNLLMQRITTSPLRGQCNVPLGSCTCLCLISVCRFSKSLLYVYVLQVVVKHTVRNFCSVHMSTGHETCVNNLLLPHQSLCSVLRIVYYECYLGR